MDSIIEHPPVQLTAIIGKGNGLVATRDLTPGTLLLDEPPLLKLDPPCKRAELLKLLGCRAFSTIDMKAAPEAIRTTIHKMILEKEVAKMSQEEKAYLFSLGKPLRPAYIQKVYTTNTRNGTHVLLEPTA